MGETTILQSKNLDLFYGDHQALKGISMDIPEKQITALIGAAASLLCTVVVGALTFFMKKTLASLEEADKRNAEDIKTLDKNLNDLKADLPLIYVTREDYIRVMNRVEDKLDQILYGGKAKGKEE